LKTKITEVVLLFTASWPFIQNITNTPGTRALFWIYSQTNNNITFSTGTSIDIKTAADTKPKKRDIILLILTAKIPGAECIYKD
jgi:hypothetical protein